MARISLCCWHNVKIMASTLFCLSLAVLPLSLLFYFWVFIFISGSSPKGKEYDKFIMNMCSSSDFAFFKTLLSWGYFKRSFKNCCRHWRLTFFPVQFAKLGEKAPDAKLIDMAGNVKYLADYIKQSSSIPLILNMGSYT